MAQVKKNVVRREAMLSVWARTARVWRRRFNGTDSGAKWILILVSVNYHMSFNNRHTGFVPSARQLFFR